MTPWQHLVATRAARVTALRLHPDAANYSRQARRLISLTANSTYQDACAISPTFAARIKALLTAETSTNA